MAFPRGKRHIDINDVPPELRGVHNSLSQTLDAFGLDDSEENMDNLLADLAQSMGLDFGLKLQENPYSVEVGSSRRDTSHPLNSQDSSDAPTRTSSSQPSTNVRRQRAGFAARIQLSDSDVDSDDEMTRIPSKITPPSFSQLARVSAQHQSHNPSSPYRALASDEFRILRLAPSSSNFDVFRQPRQRGYLQGSISVHKIGDNITYDCLSYVWGKRSMMNGIYLDGTRVMITQALNEALNALQSDNTQWNEQSHRLIWADQICINQNDNEDKTQQVLNMRRIYANARKVIAWLGHEADGSQHIPKYLGNILDAHKRRRDEYWWDEEESSRQWWELDRQTYSQLGLPGPDDSSWTAIQAFLSRPWFVRAWIVQEAVMARDLEFMCGNWCWGGGLVAAILAANIHGLLHNQVENGQVRASPAYGSLRQLMLLPNLGPEPGFLNRGRNCKWDLIDIVTCMSYAEATDDRDQLFAFLGLSLQADLKLLQPNYKKSVEEVYEDFAGWLVSSDMGAKVLYNANCSRSRNMPSWMPDWSLPGSHFRRLTPESPLNSGDGRSYMNAGGRGFAGIPTMTVSRSRRELHVRGYLVDTITKTGKQHVLGSEIDDTVDTGRDVVRFSHLNRLILGKLNEMRHMIGLTGFLSEKISPQEEVIWRTATWNRTANEETEAPHSFGMSFAAFLLYASFHQLRPGHEADAALQHFAKTWAVLQPSGTTDSPANMAYNRRELLKFYDTLKERSKQFSSAVLSPAMQSRSCLTVNSRLSSVPLEALIGDRICIIGGVAVPYVLRKDSSGTRVVGPCYLDGFMKGEVLEMGEYKAERIVLV